MGPTRKVYCRQCPVILPNVKIRIQILPFFVNSIETTLIGHKSRPGFILTLPLLKKLQVKPKPNVDSLSGATGTEVAFGKPEETEGRIFRGFFSLPVEQFCEQAPVKRFRRLRLRAL
jgi:hypothetical protein